MNITEIKETITKALSSLNYTSTYLSSDLYEAGNLNKLRIAINKLASIDIISEEFSLLKDSWIFQTYTDSTQVTSSQSSYISTLINKIKIQLQLLLRIDEGKTYSNNSNIIHIKLPEANSFEDLSRISNDLKKGIELPINDAQTGEVDILTAEPGSIWLIVSLGTVSAVKLIAGICWAASVIRKKNAEAKIFEQHAKTLELKNDSIQIFVEAQKQQLDNILSGEAEAIANKHYDHKDPETIARLKLSIETMASLIERGTKILPSSNEEEITKSFPDYNALSLIESSIRQINSGNKQ